MPCIMLPVFRLKGSVKKDMNATTFEKGKVRYVKCQRYPFPHSHIILGGGEFSVTGFANK